MGCVLSISAFLQRQRKTVKFYILAPLQGKLITMHIWGGGGGEIRTEDATLMVQSLPELYPAKLIDFKGQNWVTLFRTALFAN